MSGDQNAGQSHSIKTDNSSLERVEQFKCLGTALTDQNCVQGEIKSRLQSGNVWYSLVQNVWYNLVQNVWYNLVQNIWSSSLLYKNIKIKIHRTVILLVVLYGCETWFLILREERRLRVFENRVLRGIFGPKRDEVRGEWRKLHNEELNDLYCSPNILRVI